MPTLYCWNCYHQVAAEQEPCPHCGQPSGPPAGTGCTQRLISTLHHPLPDRRLLAARTLGERRDPTAVPPLRHLVDDPDLYVAAAGLTSLVTIAGLDGVGDLVRHLADHADAAPVRTAARQLLASAEP